MTRSRAYGRVVLMLTEASAREEAARLLGTSSDRWRHVAGVGHSVYLSAVRGHLVQFAIRGRNVTTLVPRCSTRSLRDTRHHLRA